MIKFWPILLSVMLLVHTTGVLGNDEYQAEFQGKVKRIKKGLVSRRNTSCICHRTVKLEGTPESHLVQHPTTQESCYSCPGSAQTTYTPNPFNTYFYWDESTVGGGLQAVSFIGLVLRDLQVEDD